ncbi:MAG TPA: tetratricopeptide repeat protein, partial [Planctomycetota bacterium]|nr:tetratricopeptide repeat protein [Planctomycetota bacterium]
MDRGAFSPIRRVLVPGFTALAALIAATPARGACLAEEPPAPPAQPGPGPADGQAGDPRMSKALAFLDEGDLDKAHKELERLVRDNADFPGAHAALVAYFLETGDATRALAAAKAGVEKCPGAPATQAALGRCLLASGDAAGARDAVRALAGAVPPAPAILLVHAEAAA